MSQVPRDARAQVLAALVGITTVIFLVRLFHLQVLKGESYRDLAGSQYSASRLYGMYDRGSIFIEDRGGRRLTAAGLETGFTLAINPKQVMNPIEAYEGISRYLPELDKELF